MYYLICRTELRALQTFLGRQCTVVWCKLECFLNRLLIMVHSVFVLVTILFLPGYVVVLQRNVPPYMGFPGSARSKKPACQCRRHQRRRFDLWVRKILGGRKWQPTLIFLPGESSGQRSLAARVQRVVKSQLAMTQATTHIMTCFFFFFCRSFC